MANQLVDIYFHELICDNVTDGPGNRDEIYIRVVGTTPNANISTRLPRSHQNDDYYEFIDHQVSNESKPQSWRVQDQAIVGKPFIWSGRLSPGEKANFFIVIVEQDNAFGQSVITSLRQGVNRAANTAGPNSPIAQELATAQALVNAIPDFSHDVIGAFFLSVENINNGNDVKTTWIPLKDIAFQANNGSTTLPNPADYYAQNLSKGKDEVWARPMPPHRGNKQRLGYRGQDYQSFTFNSLNNGRYRGIISAKWTNVGPLTTKVAYKYRITEFDACSKNAHLRVYDFNKNTVRMNQATQILLPGDVASAKVSSSTWYWKCFVPGQENQKGFDHTIAGVDTVRFIWVERSDNSGQIKWYCFSEEDW